MPPAAPTPTPPAGTPKPAAITLEWSDFDREPVSGLVKGPTADDVRAIVEHLGRNEEPGGFVILRRGEADFIQCAMQDDGLLVERHEPATDTHFALEGGPCDGPFAAALFVSWLNDPASVAEAADWERVDL